MNEQHYLDAIRTLEEQAKKELKEKEEDIDLLREEIRDLKQRLTLQRQRSDFLEKNQTVVLQGFDYDALQQQAMDFCESMGWKRDRWTDWGCVLHLEVSELIEACRGKGNSSPLEELGDVLFVLLTVAGKQGISLNVVADQTRVKLEQLVKKKVKHMVKLWALDLDEFDTRQES